MTALRAARPTDAGAVGTILSEFVDTTDWMPRLHSRAEDLAHAGAMIARGWVTVAERTGEVIGFAARDGDALNALYVRQAARGQGIGEALLNHAKKDTPVIELWTFQVNRAAQRFYRRHGFREVGCTDGNRNDEGLPDIQYKWTRKEP